MESSPTRITKKTVCPLDCPDTCGLIATVENGRVVGLHGDPDHPVTRGVICRKMRSYPERVHGPARLLYPMKRTGVKGKGQFSRISWDEALELFARKIREVRNRYGGQAILPYQYAGNMGVISRNAGYALYHKLGTSRLEETICSAAAMAGWEMHLPGIPGSPPEVAATADLIVAWGINIKVTNLHFWPQVVAARKRGAKFVVIDPYRNETARSADLYLQVKPGGDSALALGVLKALVEGNRLDLDMLERTSTGFSQLAAYLKNTTWDEFLRQSGVEHEAIEGLASLLIERPHTFMRIGIGLSRNSRGGMSVRAIVSLAASLGLFNGGEGRGVLLSSKAFAGDTNLLRFPELGPEKVRTVNMAHLGQALTSLVPPVKLCIVYNCNPLSVAPDSSLVRQGLKREDLFTVVHEQVMTPTARYADLVLPATTFLENGDGYTGYGHFELAVARPVIDPVGEARSNFRLFQDLARHLGYTDPPFLQSSDERLLSWLRSVDGIADPNQEYGEEPECCLTSTRKRFGESIQERWGKQFMFVTHRAEDNPGVPPFACLTPCAETDDRDLACRFPFSLIIPPHSDLLNSTFGERWTDGHPLVLMHAKDAESLSVTDGEKVRLVNFRGRSIRTVSITDDTAPGLLVAPGLFWEDGSEGGINDLTSQKTTDIGAGPTFHESRVRVEKIDS